MANPLRTYPIPTNDASRARLIDALQLQDRRSDPFFEMVTQWAKELFDVPIGYLSLLGTDVQELLHCNGADATETSREMALCAYTVAGRKTIVLPDTRLDPRTVNHPMVTDGFQLRFYASAPIILSNGFCIGTICAVDTVPHSAPSEDAIAKLEMLAAMTARFYEAPAEPDPKKAERMRRVVEEAQEEFLALISHELRTPLNGIYGLGQLLGPEDPDSQEIVQGILSSATLLNDVVESILAFTEMKSGEIVLSEAPVQLSEMLSKALHTQSASMRIVGKTLDAAELDGSLVVTADQPRLELALACLVTNFVAHGGQLAKLRCLRAPDGSVLIELRDNGDGIAPERIGRIWDAFGTGKAVHTRSADGIGLGLPLTRRIIELHGGELDIIQDGSGFSAQIRLPAWRLVHAALQ